MTLKERINALEQTGPNDHIKQIGRQLRTWIEAVEAGTMSKAEMRENISSNVGGYRDNQIIASVLNIDNTLKAELESILSEAKTFTNE